MSNEVYPDGEIPCVCCGFPMGATSAAANNGKRCFDCANFKFVNYDTPHNPAVCQQDRETVVNTYTQFCNGTVPPGRISLPSGRSVEVNK